MKELSVDIEPVMNTLLSDIQQAYANNAPVLKTTGKTGAALHVRMLAPNHGQILGYGYTPVLETGKAPGRVPKGFYYIIKQWAVDKHLYSSTEKGLSTFAYFTAKKIAAEGTSLYRGTSPYSKQGRTDILTEPLEKAKKTIADTIINLFVTSVKSYK